MSQDTIRFSYGFIVPLAYGDEQLYTLTLYNRENNIVYSATLDEQEKDNYACNKTILVTGLPSSN